MLGSRWGRTPLLAAMLLFLGVLGWFAGGWFASGPLDKDTAFTVPDGSSLSSVAVKLETEGAIASAAAFKLRARIFGAGSTIKAGEFMLPAGASMSQVLNRIAGDQVLRRHHRGLVGGRAGTNRCAAGARARDGAAGAQQHDARPVRCV